MTATSEKHHEQPASESRHRDAESSATAPSDITDKVSRKAHSLVDTAADKAAKVEKNVRVNAEDVQEKLDAKREATAETLYDSMDSVEDFVRRKPLAAAGIAFAAGVFASRLLKS